MQNIGPWANPRNTRRNQSDERGWKYTVQISDGFPIIYSGERTGGVGSKLLRPIARRTYESASFSNSGAQCMC